jgi:hypothetical protein
LDDSVRLRARGRASVGVARALRKSCAERFHAGRVHDVLRISDRAACGVICKGRAKSFLGSNDVDRRRAVRDLLDFRPAADRKPLLLARSLAARFAFRRLFDQSHQLDRTIRPSARRRVSFSARGRLDGRDDGVVALPAPAFLGLLAILREHDGRDGLRAVSLHRGCPRRPRDRRVGVCSGTPADEATPRLAGIVETRIDPPLAGPGRPRHRACCLGAEDRSACFQKIFS